MDHGEARQQISTADRRRIRRSGVTGTLRAAKRLARPSPRMIEVEIPLKNGKALDIADAICKSAHSQGATSVCSNQLHRKVIPQHG